MQQLEILLIDKVNKLEEHVQLIISLFCETQSHSHLKTNFNKNNTAIFCWTVPP